MYSKAKLLILVTIAAGAGHMLLDDADAKSSDTLYRAKCASCHRVYPPGNYTYEKFETYVARYGKGLEPEERGRLLDYLKESSKGARENKEVNMSDD